MMMGNRKLMCILHNFLLEEKYEVTGKEERSKSVDLVDKIRENLKGDELKDFDTLLDLWMGMECDSNEDNFVLGFRTGFHLALEVLIDGN